MKKKKSGCEKPLTSINCDSPIPPLTEPSESLPEVPMIDVTNNENSDSNHLRNYFNKKNNYENLEQPVMFFDNLSREVTDSFNSEQVSGVYDYLHSSSPQTTYLQNMVSNVIETPKVEKSSKSFESNYTLFSQENQPSFLAETQQIIHPNHDNLSVDDPEIKQNEILAQQLESNVEHSGQEITNYIHDNNETGTKDHVSQNDSNTFNVLPTNLTQSSVESLKQLSNQMAQAIEPEYAHYSSSITDLEKRNLELAALFEQEKLKSEQQKLFINELKAKIVQLENEKKLKEEQANLQLSNTISKLKEELQCHIQTVGLLVAEKTELSASLSQFEISCKQKNSECEELQARLKTSRSRVADLEREVNLLKNEKVMNEHLDKQQSDTYSKLKKENDDLKEQKDELLQDLLEVREKLKNSLEKNLQFQQQLEDTKSKLSLAEVKIQQVTNGKL